jgi:hypothetical protein
MVFAKKLLRCKCKKIILNIGKIMLEKFFTTHHIISATPVMYGRIPNHFHGILQIVGATLVVAQNDMVVQNNNGGNKQ